MNRAEEVRQYWEERIPQSASFYLSDVARILAHIAGEGRPIASLRTLQRRAADGSLHVQGGRDRAIRYSRVLRKDLIDFLCSLSSLTGFEPPQERGHADEG